ncbi:hypothetical protein [Bacillus sp. Marseille-Q3570]|uniref:hypothetical protein n=1 Tax=Bacillus sp. Marseille-Q3570 TaxID=2963522 RepID=UPI0021B6FE1E|nr:hypothetical protein [Bacillus sp. Marseille-Q3570]
MEKAGISTVMVTLLPETTTALGVPRSVHFSRKLGNPIGRPNQKEEQYSALLQCLDAFNKAKKGEMITGTS